MRVLLPADLPVILYLPMFQCFFHVIRSPRLICSALQRCLLRFTAPFQLPDPEHLWVREQGMRHGVRPLAIPPVVSSLSCFFWGSFHGLIPCLSRSQKHGHPSEPSSRTAEGPSASPEEREASEELQKAKAQLKEEAGGGEASRVSAALRELGGEPVVFPIFFFKVAHVLSSTTRALVTFWPMPTSQNGRGGGISGLDHVAKKKLGDLLWPIYLGSEFRMRTGPP